MVTKASRKEYSNRERYYQKRRAHSSNRKLRDRPEKNLRSKRAIEAKILRIRRKTLKRSERLRKKNC